MENSNTNLLLKKNFNSFDVAKFICSVLVVMIHVAPFGVQETTNVFSHMNYLLRQGLCRMAVPLFFVFSGFFLYRKTPSDKFDFSPTKKYLLNVLRLYILWSLIYLPSNLKTILSNPHGALHGWLKYIRNFIFLGSYTHLWYLPALLTAVLITSFLLYKKWSPKKILLTSCVFYFFGLLGNAYFGIIRPLCSIPFIGKTLELYFKIFDTTRNGLFFGFFFVALGMYLSKNDILIKSKKALLLFIMSVLLLITEVSLLKKFNIADDCSVILSTIPCSLFGFLYLKTIELKDSPVYIFMRKISSLIFYGHPFVLKVSLITSSILKVNILNTPFLFLLVLSVTILIAIAIIKLSDKRPFLWLKKFY